MPQTSSSNLKASEVAVPRAVDEIIAKSKERPANTTTNASPASVSTAGREQKNHGQETGSTVTPDKIVPWYKGGVIYEVHVRAFQDSNGDGRGDFKGLTSRLDYLRDLGVTAIWLLPFYPSPLKDDGYDISDYYNVHPHYGTLADFKNFMREAHRRDLRVITELVINHTSDQHPWFQRARRAKLGNRWRDFYVWSERSDKYQGTRIIFKDTEISNWTWDPVANAYFWHRFYSHQPDLNFDHPAVHQEVFRVLDFWMEMGVDGVRLDAVPYLYEREGTSCENLPETHEFLKRLRKHVDEKYADKMLLAEANQWPEDAVTYFGSGKGDECHMAFHFPLMPRLFMSLRMEDRVPIVDILEQTPAIPETAQWALFLRNHDELTLEMVTDEERDYMYRMYAHGPNARLNLGIRRRLAPLVDNDRRRIELLSALLFSLPGTPVIYYGDEIGMGENVYLGDRNGVRTPMQWSADKNAGFSRANPQSLYLPINLDPENHYEAVNVEVQERNPYSLLWWMKRLIGLQKQWKAFGLGTIEFLSPENRKVLVFIRRYQEECLLVVTNLSRFAQPVELNLAAYQSRVPVELFGRMEFPVITDKPYFLTLGPHAFYWFSLEARAPAQAESSGATIGAGARPVLSVDSDWQEIFHRRNQLYLERALAAWLPSRRWHSGKTRTIKSAHILDTVAVPFGAERALLTFVQVDYVQTEPETYVVPLAAAFEKESDTICADSPALVVARLVSKRPSRDGILYDAISNKQFCHALLEVISNRRGLDGGRGRLAGTSTNALRRARLDTPAATLDPIVNKTEPGSSSVVFGERLCLRIFRQLEPGVNPDLEIEQFLTERRFPYAPTLAGALEYRTPGQEPMTTGVLTVITPGSKDGWEYTLDVLGRFYERLQTIPSEAAVALPMPPMSMAGFSLKDIPKAVGELIGTYIENARQLGERTAALHTALASETNDPGFAPEPFAAHAQRGLFQSMRNLTRQNFQLLSGQMGRLSAEVRPLAQEVLALEPAIIKRFRAIYLSHVTAVRTRIHGDYHLGNVLHTGKEFIINDFAGESGISLSERRLKHSPMRDVADMIRSFQYAARTALEKQAGHGGLQPEQLKVWELGAQFWPRWVGTIFYKAYLQAAQGAAFLPATEADLRILLDTCLLRKAIYELGYELNNRPDWIKIPLVGILEMMKSEP